MRKTENDRPRVSILIPLLNERKFIAGLMKSIAEQSYPHHLIEVIAVDGGSTDGTVEWLKETSFPFELKVLPNPEKVAAPALNIGLSNASGDIIVRMDAHAWYSPTYVEQVVDILCSNPDVLNVGGSQVASGYDSWSKAIAASMTSPLGVGGARFRYAKKPFESDTVFLGAWRKHHLLAIGGWNTEWVINEDMELNLRLKESFEGRIIVDPSIDLRYFPRNSLKALARQYFRYGFWRIKTAIAYPQSLRLSHLGSVLMTLAAFLSILIQPIRMVMGAKIGGAFFDATTMLTVMYFIMVLVASLWQRREHNLGFPWDTLRFYLSTITMHLSWGTGAIFGLFRWGVPLKATGLVLSRPFGLRLDRRRA